MDIFKLLFEHDLRLDQLRERNSGGQPETEHSIEDFMKPDPTYSKFYFTGTRLQEERFGLNILDNYPAIEERLNDTFEGMHIRTASGSHPEVGEALAAIGTGEALLISETPDHGRDPSTVRLEKDSNVGHFKTVLADMLSDGVKVMYKENAHHGYDLHLFSKENIYEQFFYPLKELVGDSFRFFSINGRRVRSERQFYFETWTLDKPPHGAEEVLPDTVL